MQAEYKKDLRHNYMVIKKEEESAPEQYCSRLLERQMIDGILPMEQRYIDDKIFYYYDITAKQSMFALYEKAALSFSAVMQLFQGIMAVFDKAYDYLLPEDSFLLAPEFIYLEFNGKRPSLCYLPGYSEDMKKQMNCLLEYLMNKVDYNDKEAVLLVYQLYAVSREEGFSVNQIYEVLDKPAKPPTKEEQRINHPSKIKYNLEETSDVVGFIGPENQSKSAMQNEPIECKGTSAGIKPVEQAGTAGRAKLSAQREAADINSRKPKDVKAHGNWVHNNKDDKQWVCDLDKNQTNRSEGSPGAPRMKERIEGEKEVSCYPIKNLVIIGICIMTGILILILSIRSGILYNSFGNRIDYSKLLALMLIIMCAEGYFIRRLLDKKCRITKLVKTYEYIDPWSDSLRQSHNFSLKSLTSIKETLRPQAEAEYKEEAISMPDSSVHSFDAGSMYTKLDRLTESIGAEEEEDNPTCVLNAVTEHPPILILKALDEKNDQDIPITAFPFHIGKLKKNVDYCLENDAVSRYHAKITKEGGLFYITDLNSRNGTFLNSEPLMTYQKKEIGIGDEIAFANMKYVLTEK